MPEVMKKFAHNGDQRTAATDKLCLDIAEHAMRDTWPEVTDLATFWVVDSAGWLLYATGTIPERKEITS